VRDLETESNPAREGALFYYNVAKYCKAWPASCVQGLASTASTAHAAHAAHG
jgi:hypothetical protein